MTSGDNQDWRGGRAPRNTPRTEKAVPSWKQSRSPSGSAKAVGSGSWKRKLRILFVSGFLLALVIAAIVIMWPAQSLRTHFVLLNLRHASVDFDSAAEFRLPSEYNENTYRRIVTSSTPESLSLSKSSDNESIENLRKADVVVVYLQTTFIAAPNGTFRCLLRNSTPNLDNTNQYGELQTLKNAIKDAAKNDSGKNWLLLVDQIPPGLEWRTGFLQANVHKQFESWVTEIPELVVVLSSAESDESEPGTPGSGGRSVFSYFSSQGLTKLASGNTNRDLTKNDFCRFVADSTNNWVQKHRNPYGQIVRVIAAADDHEFVIMRDAAPKSTSTEPNTLIGNPDTKLTKQCSDLWNLRASLKQRGGMILSPIVWRTATEELKRAERAILRGLSANAEKSIVESRGQFTDLQNELESICPNDSDFQPDRGFFLRMYSTLPSAGRARLLFGNSSTEVDSVNTTALIEDIMASHLKLFTAVNGVNSDEIDATRARRKKAEESVAQLFNCSYSLQRTIPALEKALLLAEDRRFTRTRPDPAVEQHINEMLNAVPAYAEARDTAETTFRNALNCIPELAYWAAHCDCGDSEQDQKTWLEILSTNSFDTNLKVDDIGRLSDRLSVTPTDDSTELPGLARKLRQEVFQLCAYARGLKSVLSIPEPENGFNVSGLRGSADALLAWNKTTAASLSSTLSAAETLCRSAFDVKPASRREQVRVYRILQSTLDFSCVSADSHNKVLERILEWNQTWLNAKDDVSDAETTDVEFRPVPADIEALWLMQVLGLMPVSDHQANEIRRIDGLIEGLGSADTQQKPLAEFGDAVRKTWLVNQQNVSLAAKSAADHAFRQLQEADLQARLYTGFDAKVETHKSTAARLRQLAKLHYCIMQAERLMTGLWIESGDQTRPPLSENGWFAKIATAWLEAAKASSADPKVSQMPPPAIMTALQALRTRLESSNTLAIHGNFPTTSQFDLGDDSRKDVAVKLAVSETVPDSVSGEASVLIRLPVESAANRELGIGNNATPFVVGNGDAQADLSILRLGNPDSSDNCKPFELQPEVFFRGRSWQTAQNLLISTCAAREFVTEISPRTATASITVSGDDPRPVILILDFSDSMREKLADGTPRYEAAIATLKSLIQRDDLRDARVILKVFGHRVQWDPKAEIHRTNPRYEKAFPDRPIRKTLDTHNDIENMFEGTLRLDDSGNKEAFLKVLELLRSSGHWGSTPLIESIRESIATDLGRNSGIVIAITDGTPTDDGDGAKEPDRTRALQLALDSNPGTNVNVVAFDIDKNPGERNRLKATFDKFGGRISIVDASNETGLREKIQQSLDPRKFTVSWDSDTRKKETDLENSADELPPGNDFYVRFGNSISSGPLVLNPGDALRLNLLLKEKRFRVSRLPGRSQLKASSRPTENEQPWILKSIDGAQTSDIPGEDASLFAKAVLRLMLDHDDDGRIVRQPAEIEFYIRDQDSPNRPQHLSQKYDSRCGAPAWEITIDRWSKGKSFLVDAVWKMDRSVPERLVDWEILKDADSPVKAIQVNDNSTGLPASKAWITLRGQELQVRIDPVSETPYPETNRPADVRVELGQADTLEQAGTFLPWELKTSVIRTERGSVIYKFSGDKINAENLRRARIAFTSSANRSEGATVIRDFRIEY